MKKEKIVLIGMGGHSKVVFDAIDHEKYDVVGFIDKNKAENKLFDLSVIGDDESICFLKNKGILGAIISIGHVGNYYIRENLYNKLIDSGLEPITVIHKTAVVSPFAKVGKGTVVLAGAIVNAGAEIGENCIINTGAIVEHDVKIGSNVHLSPKVAIAGSATIGKNSFIGIGSSVIQAIKIGQNVVVGAGSVVVKDIKDNERVCGVPARTMKKEIL